MKLPQGVRVNLPACMKIGAPALFLILLLIPSTLLAGGCMNAAQDLRSSFEVTQGRGGIWGYMEKASSLKKDSMIGFQVDGKLQRIIVIFETHCAKNPQPTKQTFDKIQNILGDARMIFNMRPGKTPAKEIMAKISGLNASLDKLIKELEA